MFSFRALSPDNDTEIRKLIGLYKSIHDEAYPINQVYDLRFWKSHIGSKLISVGIYQQKELLGHFAIKNDPQDKNLKRICLCALAPMSTAEQAVIENGLKDFLNTYCTKNNIAALYSFTYANHWIDADIGLKQIGGTDCLICPRYVPESHSKAFIKEAETGEHISVLITAMVPQGNKPLPIAKLGVHHEISAEILEKLGFQTTKKTSMEVEKPPLRSFVNNRMKASHFYLNPSLLESEAGALEQIKNCDSKSVLVFIDISDPEAGNFGSMLDKESFRMCGVSPLHGGQNSLVYFREDAVQFPSFKAFNSPNFLNLYNHITDYKASPLSEPMIDLQHAV